MQSYLPNRVLLIEDDEFYHKVWQHLLAPDHLLIAPGFAELQNMSSRVDWENIDLIICDFYLEENRTAHDVVAWLQQQGIMKPIFLSSEVRPDDPATIQIFAGILSKSPQKALQEISQLRLPTAP